jgi:hypothetical protein
VEWKNNRKTMDKAGGKKDLEKKKTEQEDKKEE